MKGLLFAAIAIVLAAWSCAARPARAGFIDFDDAMPGAQTASWPEPSTIMVFIPAGLNGANRMNFEMGVNALVACLRRIMVQFNDGDPPQDAANAVDVNLANTNPPPFGVTMPASFHQEGQNHGAITGATMDIDPTSLTQGANFMKNLGAHEFGHALGLEEDPRQGGQRTNVMDPDFNANSPFVAPSARDKMMLREHYAVVPEPASARLACLAVVLGGVRGAAKRRSRRRAARPRGAADAGMGDTALEAVSQPLFLSPAIEGSKRPAAVTGL